MGIGGDSLRRDIAKVVLGFLRESTDIDYRALYGGQILFSDGEFATVQPDDARFGQTLSDCRVRRGDGVTASLVSDSGVRCLFGWEGGDPSKRYCLTAFDGTGSVQDLSVQANRQIDINAGTTANLTAGTTVNLGNAVGGQTLANQAMVSATATLFGVMAASFTAAAAAWGVVATLFPAPPAPQGVAIALAQSTATASATALGTWLGALSTYTTTKTKAT
ncbi:hypothetical protein K0U83_00020 [bacterium]|nr:hypothetical protein [bacterium]